MAQITVDGTENNAVAADAARTVLIIKLVKGTYPVRWSFGATYDTGDNQLLDTTDVIVLTGTPAQYAISFLRDVGIGVVDTMLQP